MVHTKMLKELQEKFIKLAQEHIAGDDCEQVIEQGIRLIRREAIYEKEPSGKGINGYPARPVQLNIPMEIESQLIAILLCRGISGDNFLETELAQNLMSELLDHLREHEQLCQAQPLPEFDWKNGVAEDFYNNFVLEPHPVVVKNFPSKASQWSVDYFVEHYSETKALLTDMTTKEHYDGCIGDLIKPAPSGGSPYIHNFENIFDQNPQLIDELGLQRLSPYLGRDYVSFAHHLFLGANTGSGAAYHCADIFNFFYQLEGKKRWYFVDPKYMFLLYPLLSEGNGYQASLVNGIRPEGQDIEEYPLYGYCPRYFVDLEPGDLLLNPPHWYHAVGNTTKRTAAVATRWSALDTVGNRVFRYLRLNADRTKIMWESHDSRWSEVTSGVAQKAWL